jgi:hypothetical protein
MSTRLKAGFLSVLSCLAIMLGLFASTGIASAHTAQATQSQVSASTSVSTTVDQWCGYRGCYRYRYCGYRYYHYRYYHRYRYCYYHYRYYHYRYYHRYRYCYYPYCYRRY